MALTFPLAEAQFMDKVRVRVSQFWCPEPQAIDETSGGSVLKASIGEALWQGAITAAPDTDFDSEAALEALISVADRAGSTFLIHDLRKPFPAADPDGSILGTATPVIASLESNNREISVSGLPANYVLTAGDLIGWEYGSNPVRYALHRLVSGATANATGETGLFEVTPFIAPVSIGTAIKLVRPPIKVVMRPNPSYGRARPGVSEGVEFSFVQTFR